MSKTSPARGRAQWLYLGLAALIAAVWFAVLAARPLFDPDEGRYAEIPREMLALHDWIIPHLDGVAYIEKPPLQYWATAAALRLLGHSEFAARFYTALCALATVVTVWLAADRLWGRPAAWRAAAALCSMLLFVVLGQLLTLDMSLTFYMTLSLTCFLMAQPAAERKPEAASARPTDCAAVAPESALSLGPVVPSSHRGWMLAAWMATALGVLTKGAVAAFIPAAVLVLYSGYARDYSPWRRLCATVGVPLFLAVSVPWFWLATLRQPGFLEFFFVHEHVSRYLTPSANREQAWWFFGAVFVLGSIPWTLPAFARGRYGLAAPAAARALRSAAVPVDVGDVHRRILLPVRLQTHPLRLARDAGPRAAGVGIARRGIWP